MGSRPVPDRAYRWSVASRALAAILGGYAVTSLVNLALPLLLRAVGVAMPQALLGSMVASFLLYAAIIMAVFHARSAVRAWAWLLGCALPLGLVIWLLPPGAQP